MTVTVDNHRQKFFDSLQSSVDVSIQTGSVFGDWKDLKTSQNHNTFNDVQIGLLLSDKNELENDKIPQKDEYPTEIFFLIHLKQKTYRVSVETKDEEEFKQGFKTIFSYYENFLEAKKEDELETKKVKIAENTEKLDKLFKGKKPLVGSVSSFFADHHHKTRGRLPFNEYQDKAVSAAKVGEDVAKFKSDQLEMVARRLGKVIPPKTPSASAHGSHQQSIVIAATTSPAGVSHSAPATTTVASAAQPTSLTSKEEKVESRKPSSSTKATGATSFLARLFSIFGNSAEKSDKQKGGNSNSGASK